MSARRWASVAASSRAVVPCVAVLRRAAHVWFAPHKPTRPPPTRAAAAFRTAHLHSGPIARTKFRCAFNAPVNREGKILDFFGPPQIWVRGRPAPGSAAQQLVVVWQAKKAAAEKQAAEEAEKVPSSPARDGCGLRRTASDTCSCVEWRHRFHSHTSALCRTPAMRLRERVRTAGRWGRLRVRSHCCSRRQH